MIKTIHVAYLPLWSVEKFVEKVWSGPRVLREGGVCRATSRYCQLGQLDRCLPENGETRWVKINTS